MSLKSQFKNPCKGSFLHARLKSTQTKLKLQFIVKIIKVASDSTAEDLSEI